MERRLRDRKHESYREILEQQARGTYPPQMMRCCDERCDLNGIDRKPVHRDCIAYFRDELSNVNLNSKSHGEVLAIESEAQTSYLRQQEDYGGLESVLSEEVSM
eukprot:GHVO01061629.1.p2 GENE.GHVO01061629.1~~GHVO01061629.1.p2  ORF type:complete len:104 (+),score=15.50 GHVO01061629.1:151-462(+)